MKKKLIALFLAVVMTFGLTVGVSGAGIDDIMGQLSENETIAKLMENEDFMDIVSAIITSDGVLDITAMVLDLVAKMDKEAIKEGAKDQVITTATSVLNALDEIINMYRGNAEIIMPRPIDILNTLFGSNDTQDIELVTHNNPNNPGREDGPTQPRETTTRRPLEPTTEPKPLIHIGDIDGDGRITAYDARLVLRASAKLEKLTKDQALRADVDGDGKITAADARKILRVSAGLEKFGVEA